MDKKTIIIIVVVLAVLCVLCAAIIGVAVALGIGMTSPVTSQGDAFMKALSNTDYKGAYNLCGSSLKKELGDPATIQEMIESQDLVPKKWNFSSTNINNDTGEIAGTMTTTSGKEATVSLVLGKAGDKWLITGFHFTEK